jgi:hypothetical protein
MFDSVKEVNAVVNEEARRVVNSVKSRTHFASLVDIPSYPATGRRGLPGRAIVNLSGVLPACIQGPPSATRPPDGVCWIADERRVTASSQFAIISAASRRARALPTCLTWARWFPERGCGLCGNQAGPLPFSMLRFLSYGARNEQR